MKPVYTLHNSLEAHVIVDLLRQHGIEANIQGELIQGLSPMQIMVPDLDVERSEQILKDWEASQQNSKITTESTYQTNSSSILAAISGLIAGFIIMGVFYNTPVSNEGIDYNADGVIDNKWFYKNGRPQKAELDRNLDGFIDAIVNYDLKGLIDRAIYDDDFDGSFETQITYSQGLALWLKTDTNEDGFKDYRIKYRHGLKSHIYYLDKHTGYTLKEEVYAHYRLTYSLLDLDNDGDFDTKTNYGALNEVVSRVKLTP